MKLKNKIGYMNISSTSIQFVVYKFINSVKDDQDPERQNICVNKISDGKS